MKEEKEILNMSVELDKSKPYLTKFEKAKNFNSDRQNAYAENMAFYQGNQHLLKRYKNNDINTTTKKPQINFAKCGIPIGAELVFIEDTNIKVTVVSEKKVEYKGEEISLSTLAQELKHLKSKPQGTAFFMYNGRPLIDIASETQWK